MFESIIYKNSIGPGPLIDIGALAEGLLFYGRVSIVGNTGTVKDVLARIPPFVLLSLMREGRLEFYYLTDQTGVSTNQATNGRSLHGLVQFSSPNNSIDSPRSILAANLRIARSGRCRGPYTVKNRSAITDIPNR